MPELSDEQIMLLVKDGHLSELAELFDRYHVKLYNFFLKLTFDTNTSEDLTQSLFYRVIKYRQSFEPGNGTFRSWIYRMARNIHADFCKQEQKRSGRIRNIEELAERPAIGEQGYTEDHFEKLDLALAGLYPDQREIIVLSRYQGLKYEEISKIKEISVAAIKVQVHRAIKHLRSLYFKQSS
ncbi:MAG TPA: RNA polymerase sigma factor [Puia sp.]